MTKKIKKRDFLKNAAKATAGMAGFPLIKSCKPKDENTELDFLNYNKSWSVDPHPNREPSVKQLGFIQTARGQMNESMLNIIASKAAALPDAYLQYLDQSSNNGFYLEVNNFGQGWAGLCMLGDPPGFVKVQSNHANSGHVFNHECGHAIMYAAFKGLGGKSTSSALLQKVYSEAQQSAERSNTWSYAMKNYREYWACGVSSYYASRACREDLRANFPVAYQYFNTALVDPPQDTPIGSGGGIPQQPGNNPQPPGGNQPPTNPFGDGGTMPKPPNSGNNNNNNNFNNQNFNNSMGQLQAALQNLIRAMQMSYQAEFYRQMNRYSLTYQKKGRIDMVQHGMEINEGMDFHIELVPGYKDLSPTVLKNFNVYLKAPNSRAKIELPSSFHYSQFLIDGHAISRVMTPKHRDIAKLVRGKFAKAHGGIPKADLQLIVTDPNNRVVDFRNIEYVQMHADDAKVISPMAFSGAHRKQKNKL